MDNYLKLSALALLFKKGVWYYVALSL